MNEKQANILTSLIARWASKPQSAEVADKFLSGRTNTILNTIGERLEPAAQKHAPEIGKVIGRSMVEGSEPLIREMVPQMGEGMVRGIENRLDPVIRKKLMPLLRQGVGTAKREFQAGLNTLKKEAPKITTEAIGAGTELIEDNLANLARNLSTAAGAGAVTGAATAPSGEHIHGATRGAVGGLLGGGMGAAWGRLLPKPSVLPSVAGALLGGAAGGGTLRENSPVRFRDDDTFGKESSMEGHKYAGVTLDWYDDNGLTLKDKFPKLEAVPGIIKEASIRPKEKLANEDFALIMVDKGHVFRKFACTDPGTTAMSVIYFMEHGDKLPESAQKIAAANLVSSCLEHDIMPPAALTKAVGGKSLRMLSSDEEQQKVSSMDKGAIGAIGRHLLPQTVIPQAFEAVRGVGKANQVMKGTLRTLKKNPTLLTDPKSAIKADNLMQQAKTRGLEAKNLWKNYVNSAKPTGSFGAMATKTSSVVDVTGKRPRPIIKTAKPSRDEDYAVVLADGTRKYPIHTWDMVKKAEVYFLDNIKRFQPEERRQFATKLAAKAEIMGYPLEGTVQQLGSPTYADDQSLQDAIDMRKVACDPTTDARRFLDDLLTKHASIRPEVYAECLKRFDINEGLDKGWDQVIPDPWASTFGKAAAEVVWEDGADMVTKDALINLAQNRLNLMVQKFTFMVANEFQKDPVGIFESMPAPQKRIIARMAADVESDGSSEHGTNQ